MKMKVYLLSLLSDSLERWLKYFIITWQNQKSRLPTQHSFWHRTRRGPKLLLLYLTILEYLFSFLSCLAVTFLVIWLQRVCFCWGFFYLYPVAFGVARLLAPNLGTKRKPKELTIILYLGLQGTQLVYQLSDSSYDGLILISRVFCSTQWEVKEKFCLLPHSESRRLDSIGF